MKVLLINSVCGIRSTGRICAEIAREYESAGHEVRIAYGRMDELPLESRKWAVKIGGVFSTHFHALMTRLFDMHGTGICSRYATRRFLRWAEGWKPNLVWLHNIHGYYINYELLFKWIKQHPEMEVWWTLHDCWAFTGHCAYFTAADCDKWKSGCVGCPIKRDYPSSLLVSRSKENLLSKKKAFSGVKDMSLITPSKWLADLTRESFLNEYPVRIVHNTIDTSVFKPTPSDFRQKLGLEGKTIILGVASVWNWRKGLDDFMELRQSLDDSYSIVLVGLTKRQISSLPNGVIGISRTNNAHELAGIYSSADWFFNPTHEDNYPTVNLEAKACCCNIVTYDTGGASETVDGYENALVLRGDDKSPAGFLGVIKHMDSKRSKNA